MKVFNGKGFEAVQWDGSVENADEIEIWSEGRTLCFGRFVRDVKRLNHPGDYVVSISIDDQDENLVGESDWIVKRGTSLTRMTDGEFQNEHGQVLPKSS